MVKRIAASMALVALMMGIWYCDQEPNEIQAAHILIMYEGAARAPEDLRRSKEEARQIAEELLERQKAGEDFQELAREYSDGPSSVNGGVLNPFGRGKMMPAFEEAAFALDKGEVSGIVETDYGFHIIKRLR